VLLLDRADFPRDKPCGDGIAPHAVDLWASLGVPDITAGYAPVPELRLQGPGGATALRRMARPAYVVPRSVLDARLVAAAVAAGAVLQRRHIRTVTPGRDGVRLAGGAGDDVLTRVVVAADGANGVVGAAARGDAAPSGSVAIAIRGYAPVDGGLVQSIVMDADDRWPAYAWSFPLADGSGRANVGYGVLLDGSGSVSRAALLAKLRALVPGSERASALRAHHLPLASWRPGQPDSAVLLAGDAAHLINPLTGEGIWYAAVSGLLAGQAAVTSPQPAATYRAALRRRLGRHHRDVRLLSRWGRSPRLVDAAVQAGARRQAVFDDLVEFGLADGVVTPGLLTAVLASAARR
jgi:flavin-dependent dehydrogenase